MSYIHDDWRRLFQQVKKMTLEQFVQKMNRLHSNAWHRCYVQYGQAMDIALTPKQREAVGIHFKKIVTEWDGMSMVDLDLQQISEEEFADIVKENRRLGQDRMIEIVKRYCANK
jgi:hypothetical protein